MSTIDITSQNRAIYSSRVIDPTHYQNVDFCDGVAFISFGENAGSLEWQRVPYG